MHTVLVAGLILTPLCALWLVIAEGSRALTHPLDLSWHEFDRERLRQVRLGWRLYYRMHAVERLVYRLGLLAGVSCLVAAAAAGVLS